MMRDFANWALDTAKVRGATYADARVMDIRLRDLSTKNGQVGTLAESESYGIGIRVIAQGSWEGHIARQARGTGGFGYDPIFVPSGSARSAAELSATEKNAVSHRALALRALLAQLRAGTALGAGTG